MHQFYIEAVPAYQISWIGPEQFVDLYRYTTQYGWMVAATLIGEPVGRGFDRYGLKRFYYRLGNGAVVEYTPGNGWTASDLRRIAHF